MKSNKQYLIYKNTIYVPAIKVDGTDVYAPLENSTVVLSTAEKAKGAEKVKIKYLTWDAAKEYIHKGVANAHKTIIGDFEVDTVQDMIDAINKFNSGHDLVLTNGKTFNQSNALLGDVIFLIPSQDGQINGLRPEEIIVTAQNELVPMTSNNVDVQDIKQNALDIQTLDQDVKALDSAQKHTENTSLKKDSRINTTDDIAKKSIVEASINGLDGRINTNKADIATNKTNITSNRVDIDKNRVDIDKNIACCVETKKDIVTNTNEINALKPQVAYAKGGVDDFYNERLEFLKIQDAGASIKKTLSNKWVINSNGDVELDLSGIDMSKFVKGKNTFIYSVPTQGGSHPVFIEVPYNNGAHDFEMTFAGIKYTINVEITPQHVIIKSTDTQKKQDFVNGYHPQYIEQLGTVAVAGATVAQASQINSNQQLSNKNKQDIAAVMPRFTKVESDVAKNKTDIAHNNTSITTNATQITANKTQIETNKNDIAHNKTSINTLNSQFSQSIHKLDTKMDKQLMQNRDFHSWADLLNLIEDDDFVNISLASGNFIWGHIFDKGANTITLSGGKGDDTHQYYGKVTLDDQWKTSGGSYETYKYFTQHAQNLTENNTSSTVDTYIGKAYKGIQSYGYGAEGNVNISSHAKGKLIMGQYMEGDQYVGYASKGRLFSGFRGEGRISYNLDATAPVDVHFSEKGIKNKIEFKQNSAKEMAIYVDGHEQGTMRQLFNPIKYYKGEIIQFNETKYGTKFEDSNLFEKHTISSGAAIVGGSGGSYTNGELKAHAHDIGRLYNSSNSEVMDTAFWHDSGNGYYNAFYSGNGGPKYVWGSYEGETTHNKVRNHDDNVYTSTVGGSYNKPYGLEILHVVYIAKRDIHESDMH